MDRYTASNNEAVTGTAKRRAEALKIHRQGRLDEAERRYRALLADAPDDGETWHYLAVLCGQSERHAEAVECCERALACGYRGVSVHANMANALLVLDRPHDSAAALARAVAADPSAAELVLELAERRASLCDEQGALEVLEDASHRLDEDAVIVTELGQIAARLNRGDTALAAFRRAVKLAPESAVYWANLGSVLQMCGDRQGAEQAYMQALDTSPELIPCYWYLAQLRRISPDESLGKHILAMAAADDAAPSAMFAAARVLANAGNATAAFRHYKNGNARVRDGYRYSVQRAVGDMAALAKRTTHAALSPPAAGPVPIFIVGMPRSGSTLIEQMLGRHAAIAAGGENPWLQRLTRDALNARGLEFPVDQDRLSDDELVAIRGAYLDSLTARGGDASFITDKLPANFLCVPVVRRLFPNALVVHARRDALETCWSCYKHLFAAPQGFAYDLCELAQYYRACTVFIERTRQSSERVIELTLAGLLAAPEQELTALLARLGLPWDSSCLTPERTTGLVATASALQTREGLSARPRQDAAAYHRYLGPLVDGLREAADRA